jgi:hypothetical protein
MKHERASKALISFSELGETLRRGTAHTINDDRIEYDPLEGVVVMQVRRSKSIELKHYQGESTLNVQVDLDDQRTTVVVTGGQVMGKYMSDGSTVLLRLKGTVSVLVAPSQ